MAEFKAVICVNGDDSRLFPLTETTPTGLLPVANRPLLLYALDMLERAGFGQAIVAAPLPCVQAVAGLLQRDREAPGRRIQAEVVPVEDSSGSADVLRQLADRLQGADVAVLGDALVTEAPLHDLADVHRVNGSSLTMLLKADTVPAAGSARKQVARAEEDVDYVGLVEREGRVVSVLPALALEEGFEVPKALLRRRARVAVRRDLADSQLYLVAHWVLALLEAVPSISSVKDDLLPYLVARQFRGPGVFPPGVLDVGGVRGQELALHMSSSERSQGSSYEAAADDDTVRVYAHVLPGDDSVYCRRVSDLASFAALNRDVVSRPASVHTPWPAAEGQAVSFRETLVAEGTELGDKVSLKECVVGPGCRIGTRSKLNNCIVMEGAVIGDHCILQNCIVCPGAVVHDRCNLKESQLGAGAVVPEGSSFNQEMLTRDSF